MSEKEFLEDFIDFLGNLKGNNTVFYNASSEQAATRHIDEFLEAIHHNYYEVEFIKLFDEEDNPKIEGIEIESNYAKEQRYK